jgi:hypothetical protein
MDSDNPQPRIAKENSPQIKFKVDAQHDFSQVLERVNLQGMVITDKKDHHERTFVKGRDSGSVLDPGSGTFLTPGSGIRNRFFPDPGSQNIFLRA